MHWIPQDARAVLQVPVFRRLWVALSLASLGDWLGLLALTALAPVLAGGGYAAANLAVAGVFLLRLAPAMLLGPLAGVVADRLDRRTTMVVANALRAGVLASIPLVGRFWWLFVATFLIEAASMFFLPAKEATVPNLVPRERLEAANQLNLLGTYGTAPLAAVIFAALSLLSGVLDNAVGSIETSPVSVALWFNAATFAVSAVLIARIQGFPARAAAAQDGTDRLSASLLEGWRFASRSPVVRGLVVGMLGAFAAAGAVMGLARTHVTDLGAGDPGYGLLFGVVFLGLAAGMGLGPGALRGLSRRRLFSLSVMCAGLGLALLALIPNMVIAVLLTTATGACAGVAWVTGYTLLGLEVQDEVRGRTFAFVQTMVRVTLVVVLAIAPLLAAALGRHTVRVSDVTVPYGGAALTFLVAGLIAAALGTASLRQMDDRPGMPLWRDVLAALRGHDLPEAAAPGAQGFLLAFEGGEGAGKSTQAQRLAAALRERGHEVVVTREPGGTPVGQQLRELLLDPGSAGLTPRAEALLYAADRAEHVAKVLRPALARGAVVVTDRYLDSSVAYQGAGRVLSPEDVLRISRWAAEGLMPDLTVVLDVPPGIGLRRSPEPADRLESEAEPFHERVRAGFLGLAARSPGRYLVLDATLPAEELTSLVLRRVQEVLPAADGGGEGRGGERDRVGTAPGVPPAEEGRRTRPRPGEASAPDELVALSFLDERPGRGRR